MTGDVPSRSEELDQVRKMLFPELPPEEGWARIDAAIAGAAAERRAGEPPTAELPDELLALLRDTLRDTR
jgi:hypothetical protein